jgi:sugar lactone lactonase YvrE
MRFTVTALAVCVVLTGVATGDTVGLTPGTILVTDFGLDAVIAVDPTTGNRTVISDASTGNLPHNFWNPRGIAMAPTGMILVADMDASALYRVDPTTGQGILQPGETYYFDQYISPQALTVDSAGYAIVGDLGVVISVEPRSDGHLGALRTVSGGVEGREGAGPQGTGPGFAQVTGIAIDDSGNILIADGGSPQVLSIDPATGNRTLVSSATRGTGTAFLRLQDLTVDSNGSILVLDSMWDAVFSIDPDTGDRTVISDSSRGTGPLLHYTRGMTLDLSGNILVTDSVHDAVILIDPVSGNRTIVSDASTGTGPTFLSPAFLTVVPGTQVVPLPTSALLGILGLGFLGGLATVRRVRRNKVA